VTGVGGSDREHGCLLVVRPSSTRTAGTRHRTPAAPQQSEALHEKCRKSEGTRIRPDHQDRRRRIRILFQVLQEEDNQPTVKRSHSIFPAFLGHPERHSRIQKTSRDSDGEDENSDGRASPKRRSWSTRWLVIWVQSSHANQEGRITSDSDTRKDEQQARSPSPITSEVPMSPSPRQEAKARRTSGSS
jgi:hypothetical protein